MVKVLIVWPGKVTDLTNPTIEEMCKAYANAVMETLQGNHSFAAKVLGVDRRSVQRMLERWELRGRWFRGNPPRRRKKA